MIAFHFPLNTLPKIIYANDIDNNYEFIHFQRQPMEFVLFYIVKGNMYIEENGKKYHLTQGDYIILDPKRCHKGYKTSAVHYFYIHFTWENATETTLTETEYMELAKSSRTNAMNIFQRQNILENHLIVPKHFKSGSSNYKSIYRMCREMKKSYHEMLEYYQCITAAKLIGLLGEITRLCDDSFLSAKREFENQNMTNLLEYLKENYKEKITGRDIENALHSNFDYLNRRFKKYTGMTIFQYLNEFRILCSQEMLRSSHITLREIALENGFVNEFYFSRVFKKITGNTPTDYRLSFLDFPDK